MRNHLLAAPLLVMLVFSVHAENAPAACPGCKIKSTEEIMDEVENGIDNDDCGLRGMTRDLIYAMSEEGKQELNQKINEVLEQYDLQCLSSLLRSGLSSVFPIPEGNFSFCEFALDQIQNRSLFIQTPQGMKLRSELEATQKARDAIERTMLQEQW